LRHSRSKQKKNARSKYCLLLNKEQDVVFHKCKINTFRFYARNGYAILIQLSQVSRHK